MSKHRVEINRWVNGQLELSYHEFDGLEDALTFTENVNRAHVKSLRARTLEEQVEQSELQVVKIYDPEQQCIHTTANDGFSTDTYA